MTGPYYNWPMPQQHTRLSQYYEELISVPRAHVRMELSQDENGVTLAHDGKALLECRLTRQGMAAAGFMAQALGVSLPALGQAVPVRVSTGVLYRAGAVAALDYDEEASFVLLPRLLEEAQMQRGGSSDSV